MGRKTRSVTKKRKQNLHAEDVSIDPSGMEVVKEAFRELVKDASVTTVDPKSCIPFTRVRKLSASGIKRLKESFHGTIEGNGGVTSGGVIPTVVMLDGAYNSYPLEYWKAMMKGRGLSNEESEKEASKIVGSQQVWYGVVDGAHRLRAIEELIREEPRRWSGFSWTVMVIKSTDLSELRSFARNVNEKQKEEYVIVQTAYDTLRYLKDEINKYIAEHGSSPSAVQIAKKVMVGQHWAVSTMTQLARTASRLSEEVIEELGEILNSEHPALAQTLQNQLPPHRRCRGTPDCRIYKDIISSSSLKQATNFMKCKDNTDSINTLKRVKYYASQNNYKPVSYAIVEKQYAAAVAARLEAIKFERYLQTDQWPEEMKAAKGNLLHTTLFDAAIDSNRGNEQDILPPLLELHRFKFPDDSFLLHAKFKASFDSDAAPSALQSGSLSRQEADTVHNILNAGNSDEPPEVVPFESPGTENIHATVYHQERETSGDSPENSEHCTSLLSTENPSGEGNMEGEESLVRAGIRHYQMTWQQYELSVRNTSNGECNKFDFILTDPPYSLSSCNQSSTGRGYNDYIDEEEIESFSRFCRRTLKPGCYFVIFSSFQLLPSWWSALRKAGMVVTSYPLLLVKDSATLTRNKSSFAPQNCVEPAVMGYLPGGKANQFKLDLFSSYSVLKCTHSRKFCVLDNVKVPKKLCVGKSPVRIEEKSTVALTEILATFCPPRGLVFDGYAGTMTTAISCAFTSRKCIVVEKDPHCYDLSLQRLKRICSHILNDKIPRNPATHGNVRHTSETISSILEHITAELSTTRKRCRQNDGDQTQSRTESTEDDPSDGENSLSDGEEDIEASNGSESDEV